jgi:integrase/recombinase XerD
MEPGYVCRARAIVGRASLSNRHGLRPTFCTGRLIAGVAIRDMQQAMRRIDPRTTLRYDMAKVNRDRHAAHAVAAYVADMSTG